MNQNEKSKKIQEPLNWKEELVSWIKIIITAALIALFLNSCIIANSNVPSGSMENTIMTDDRVIGFRLSYLFAEPERGDIVIFHWPDNEEKYFVKRIIGLPGDTVDIKGSSVYINGSETPLDEPYLSEEMIPENSHYEVPKDCYFMMGDNRNSSLDSRGWEKPFVHKNKIVAKVLFRYYPNFSTIR